jgi:hypothetical protein
MNKIIELYPLVVRATETLLKKLKYFGKGTMVDPVGPIMAQRENPAKGNRPGIRTGRNFLGWKTCQVFKT